jgi:SPP1 gp7 family putative phage head morphogenesis protein
MADLTLEPLPPAEAIRFFEDKGYTPSFAWQDVWQQEHARGFTVAKMMRHDLLETVRRSLDKALREGTPFATWAKDLMPTLQAEGWWGRQEMRDPLTGEIRDVQLGSPHRLRTIFDTNLRTARAAGRWERIERNAERRPYLRYSAIQDARTRPEHAAWHGLIRRWDDPIWETLYPPNGWNCRCLVQQYGERDLARKGWSVTSDREAGAIRQQTREWVNRRTGEILEIQDGVDPGFGYNVGRAHMRALTPAPLDRPIDWPRRVEPGQAPPWPGDVVVPASRLLPAGLDDEAAAGRFLEAFGAAPGRPVVLEDKLGEPVVIDESFLQHRAGGWKLDKGERRRMLLLLAETLRNPTEIWWHWDLVEQTQEYRLRRTYLATFDVEGSQVRGIVGVEIGKDGWRGTTAFDGKNIRRILSRRAGVLAYRRASGDDGS